MQMNTSGQPSRQQIKEMAMAQAKAEMLDELGPESMAEVEPGQFEADILAEEEAQAAAERERKDRLDQLGHRLHQLATDQVNRRQDIENRWIEDLRQYNGMYDEKTMEALKKGKGSQLFVNMTRPKTTMVESRISDMLFPTDEKNWGIKPTPVPEIDSSVAELEQVDPNAMIGQTQMGAPVVAGDLKQSIAAIWKEAETKAKAMEQEINDQLEEAGFTIKSRDAIHDACVYGTGVLKGPCILGRSRKKWEVLPDGSSKLTIVEDVKPTVERVNIWDFFPDMSATRIEDAEFVFERHFLTKKQLKDLCKTPGFDKEAIMELLSSKPTDPLASYRQELRSLSGVTGVDDNRYEVWEYHGSVNADDLIACGCEDVTEADAAEMEAVVFFCQGKVLKAFINPVDTEERPYSVYNWEEDDSSIFGFGVPRLLATAQKALNAAWRMMMDNGGLSTGPQIIVNAQAVRPVDGSWQLTPRKVWELTDRARNVNDVFAAFEVNSHLSELNNIYQLSRAMGDDLLALPQIAQGEAAPHLTQTAKGMSILMNAANSIMRRAVKSWDDDVTKPLIGRFYDFNMQYSEKSEIKGDLSIVARGSSSLIEREGQTERLLQLLQIGQSFGPMLKLDAVARKLVNAMNLPSDDLIRTEKEMKEIQDQQAQQGQPVDPKEQNKQMELQLKARELEIEESNNQMDHETETQNQALRLRILESEIADREQRVQLELQKMANARSISVDQLRAQLGMQAQQIQSEEKQLAAELEAKMKFGTGV
jgi:hypothetical protein